MKSYKLKVTPYSEFMVIFLKGIGFSVSEETLNIMSKGGALKHLSGKISSKKPDGFRLGKISSIAHGIRVEYSYLDKSAIPPKKEGHMLHMAKYMGEDFAFRLENDVIFISKGEDEESMLMEDFYSKVNGAIEKDRVSGIAGTAASLDIFRKLFASLDLNNTETKRILEKLECLLKAQLPGINPGEQVKTKEVRSLYPKP